MKEIMVIDDSETIRQAVSLILKEFGLKIRQAENGLEGLKEIEEVKKSGNDVAICVTDVNMPVMDGLTFVKEFRKKDKFTPILMLTTEAGESTIREGKKAGASGWIVKPFKTDQFLDTVKMLIK